MGREEQTTALETGGGASCSSPIHTWPGCSMSQVSLVERQSVGLRVTGGWWVVVRDGVDEPRADEIISTAALRRTVTFNVSPAIELLLPTRFGQSAPRALKRNPQLARIDHLPFLSLMPDRGTRYCSCQLASLTLQALDHAKWLRGATMYGTAVCSLNTARGAAVTI